jgi:hypothetical protein
MPERAKSLSSAFLAGTLAIAALPGVNTIAAAAECLEGPDLQVTQPGHWYYRLDRTLNRRCWHFEPAESAATTPASAAPAPAATDDAQPSFFSRLAAGFSQGFSPPQQQNSIIPETSGESAQAVSPKPAKPTRAVRRERPHAAPSPTTTGAAADEPHDQPPQAAAAENHAAEKNEKHDPPINVAEREALFQDFIKWQMERNMFGRP